ncbi:DUF1800 family protein [Bordetella sp. N]|uniref:DUF1800 domain-containing protein n=1 Tax=Bordetella sp. N TaxID=1746199 RepID=UPI0007088DD4|nr:DUF1800 domain-containing protein [Bordetella sp. N]ALM86192.1 hypothetical protein ASB57_27465 [Bordetella sp. N]
MNTTSDTRAAIALNRYGLGARPDETPPTDPKASLLAQFERYDPRPAAWANQPGSAALTENLTQLQQAARASRGEKAGQPDKADMAGKVDRADKADMAGKANKADKADADDSTAQKTLRTTIRDTYWNAVDARVQNALVTPTPFVERLVHFWANHFALSTDKGPAVAMLAGAFEAEAIRPHVLGRFEDMLLAVERHPAMQLFLDQPTSVGPDSKAVLRAEERKPSQRRGLNENLAREIMELHTLGARSGYTQADVTEFARALTGWSIVGPKGQRAARDPDATPGSFVFRPAVHEPGARTILGRRYDQQGEAQARAVLTELAAAPATARHVAGKLARHFIADTPPPEVVDRLAQAYLRGNGELLPVYRTLLDLPQAWAPTPVKFKTPWEWLISSLRGLGRPDMDKPRPAPTLAQLGQAVWRPGSPAGYDDVAASWAAPDALVRRVEFAQRLAARMGDRVDPQALGRTLLAGTLSPATASAVGRAESVQTAVALLLVAPDFQRR